MRNQISKLTLIAALAASSFGAFAIDITGAGSTFQAPVMTKWAEQYNKVSGTKLNYASIGSSGGVKQIREKTVDFGATDAPLNAATLEKDGFVQFPNIMGGIVAIVNLESFKQGDLVINGPTLANIFAGKISNWNDPAIALLNPGKKFPNLPITVVGRSDGSGTTAVFTDYLSKVSKEWADTTGSGATVKWQADSFVGGKGNEGVANNVSRLKGSIGYVEYAYAKLNKLTTFDMRNADGKIVKPSLDSFKAAAANAKWDSVPGMGIYLTEQPGANSWPITAVSFIVMYKNPAKKETSAETLKFFAWVFKNGDKISKDLEYVSLPASLTDTIAKTVWTQVQQ